MDASNHNESNQIPLSDQIPEKYQKYASNTTKIMNQVDSKLECDNDEDEDDDEKPAVNAKGGTNTHINIPYFLLKTYDIVNDESTDEIVCWNEEGNGFIVKNVNLFSDQILPKYFKHK